MTLKSVISAILVAVFSLFCMLGTQNADLNLGFAALCCSPYVILMTMLYFHFNFIRKKLNFLQKPNIFLELFYGFVFYLAFSLLLPVLLFVNSIGDDYEHRLYAGLWWNISEMLPIFLSLSIFLTLFSSIIIVWALKSSKILIPVLIGCIILTLMVSSVTSDIQYHNTTKKEVAKITGNIQDDRYEFYGSMSNPTGYPVQLYKGRFIFQDDDGYQFTFSEGNGVNYKAKWGAEGTKTRTQVMSLPKAIDITWYSFVEDVFYRVNSPVDYNKLLTLFSKPYAEKRRKRIVEENYNCIVMGLAPGGVLVVWATGNGRRKVEIGCYQGEKIVIAKKVSDTNEMEYGDVFNQKWRKKVLTDTLIVPSKTQQLTKNKPIPYGYWDKLTTSYNWRPKFIISPEIKVYDADFSFYNAERFVFFDEGLHNSVYEKRGVPENVYIKWYDNNDNRCAVDFDFNEEQVFKKFNTFFNVKKNTRAEIEFSIDKENKIGRAILKNGENQLLLLETEILEYGKSF
ncbi:DUF2931 family protein [Pedobacter sp. UYP1]|uniref:DUF2931 family protein n=1 Tax=Pedobacter sp. UYP1 TaxID=1756396 RepID=UPI00339870A7